MYTKLEQEILDEIIQDHQDGNSYLFAIDIIDRLGDTKIYRGALASLVKKGVIDVDVDEGGLLSVYDEEIRKACDLETVA
jgi:DNA polymerase III alpha subunit